MPSEVRKAKTKRIEKLSDLIEDASDVKKRKDNGGLVPDRVHAYPHYHNSVIVAHLCAGRL